MSKVIVSQIFKKGLADNEKLFIEDSALDGITVGLPILMNFDEPKCIGVLVSINGCDENNYIYGTVEIFDNELEIDGKFDSYSIIITDDFTEDGILHVRKFKDLEIFIK